MDPELQEFLGANTRELLDFIFDGVYIVDTDRRIQYWNRGAEQITGYSAADVSGRFCRDNILNHIDENGALVCVAACPLVRAIRNGENVAEKLYPLHKSGRRFPVSTHIGPIRGRNDRIIGAIEVFRDISSEEQLRQLERKFRRLIRQYVSEATYTSVLEASEAGAAAITANLKDLTVLFLDVVDFTVIAEQHDPHKMVEILNSLFSMTAHIIQQNSGDIDKFIGDCAMAVFIDAADAVKAARAIVEQGLPTLNTSLEDRGLPPVQVRVGLNSGELVQADIGSQTRKDMTVIGDVVNTAARVEAVAEPGTFLISESTLARLPDQDRFVFLCEIVLKGKATPVRLFRPGPDALTPATAD